MHFNLEHKVKKKNSETVCLFSFVTVCLDLFAYFINFVGNKFIKIIINQLASIQDL